MYCTCLASWASRPPKSPLAPRSCASGTSGRGTSNEQARQPVMDCNLYKLFVLRSRTPGGAIFAQTGSQGPGAQNSVECRGPSPSPCLSGEPPSLRPNWLGSESSDQENTKGVHIKTHSPCCRQLVIWEVRMNTRAKMPSKTRKNLTDEKQLPILRTIPKLKRGCISFNFSGVISATIPE
ncbi:uncharacterized protein LOC106007734 isoform X2 [Heterocephalus glaber]|nr:uncharacterized protein LOC106007734 isoform X2 [Heterocephalus glaber]